MSKFARRFFATLCAALFIASAYADPGFMQSKYTGSSKITTGDPFTDANAVLVPEPGMLYIGNFANNLGHYTVNGITYEMGNNSVFAYKAYWRMTAGVVYRFAKGFDDWGYISLTSPSGTKTAVIDNPTHNSYPCASYTPLETGWYVLELRVGQGTGGVGPNASPYNDASKLGVGLAWTDSTNVTSNACNDNNYQYWKHFENPAVGAPIFLTIPFAEETTATYANGTISVSSIATALPYASNDLKIRLYKPDGTIELLTLANGVTTGSSNPHLLDIPNIDADSTYGYQLVAVGTDVSEDGAVHYIYTGTLTITAGSNMNAGSATPATFTVSRGDTEAATQYDLELNYSLGGTAEGGVDYIVPLELKGVIPAGSATGTVAINPLFNPDAVAATTLVLTLEDGGYDGAGASAQVNVAQCSYAWRYESSTSVITDGDWELNVGAVTGGLRVNSVKTVGTEGHTINMRNVVNLPSPIVAINENAFKDKTTIYTVLLPDTLTTIGNYAFMNCTYLDTVSPFLPASVSSIGVGSFRSCGVESDLVISNPQITQIPNEVNGHGTFRATKIKHVDLSGATAMTRVGNAAFQECGKIESVKLPPNVTVIGNYAFDSDTSLKSVTPFLPASVTSIGTGVFYNCPIENELVISNSGMTSIPNESNGHGAFRYSKIPNIDFSESGITTIGSWSFSGCTKLESVKLPANLTTVKSGAFNGDTALRSVTPYLPDTLTTIEATAFYNCPIEQDLVISNPSFKTIPNDSNSQGVFMGNKSKHVDLSQSGLTSIGGHAFRGNTSLLTVRLPDSVKSIGSWTFSSCSGLTDFQPFLPTSLTSVGTGAFYGTPIAQDLVISNPGFTSIPADSNSQGVFMGIKSKHVDLSQSGLTSIGGHAFKNITTLLDIRLPESVKTIGAWTFSGCSHLTDFEPFLPTNTTSLGTGTFNGTPIAQDLVISNPGFTSIPTDSNSQGVFNGIKSKHIDMSGSGITSIGAHAFRGVTTLETVKLPETLQKILNQAFNGCTALYSVEPLFPHALTQMDYSAFRSCTKLNGDLVIDNTSFTTIPVESNPSVGMFQSSKLKSADLSRSGIKTIKDYAFRSCSTLASVSLPSTLTTTSREAFNGCSALKDIVSYAPPSALTGTDVLKNVGSADYSTRILYQAGDTAWEDYAVTAWADAGDKQDTYNAEFPDGPQPRGFASFNNRHIWLVPMPSGTVSLSILATCDAVGEPGPGYGMHINVQGPLTCTNVLYGATSTIGYECTGYRLEKLVDGVWNTEATGNTTSCTFNPQEVGEWRLTWLWCPIGYTLTVSSEADKVTLTGNTVASLAGFGTYYLTNSVVSAQATPLSGYTFQNWFGNVPAGQEEVNPVDITMNAAKTIYPYFESDCWIYESNNNTIHDDYWTLNVSTVSSNELKITGVKSGGAARLNLAKPVTDGKFIGQIAKAFNGRTTLNTLLLPSTLTKIEGSAFDGCSGLKSVSPFLPAALTSIGARAFNKCPIENDLVLSNPGLTTLANETDGNNGIFRNIKSKNADLSQSGITLLGAHNFRGSSLRSIQLPLNVVTIGTSCFDECSSLTNVVPFLPATVTSIGARAFNKAPVANDLVLSNPGLTTLANEGDGNNGIFRSIKSKNADLSQSGITLLGSHNFRGSSLRSIQLPLNVVTIGTSCFDECSSLTNVVPFLPATVTSIGARAFNKVPVANDLVISNPGLTTLANEGDGNNGIFRSIKSKNADLSRSGITLLGSNNFRGSSLRSILLPPTVVTIGSCCFQDCSSLTNVVPFLPDSVTSVGSRAFCNTYVANDLIIANPNFTTTVADSDSNNGTFRNIRSKVMDFSKSGITVIAKHSFRGASKVKTIRMPKTLTSIETTAFTDISSLQEIYWYPLTSLSIYKDAFGASSMQFIHYIPIGSDFWEDYIDGSCELVRPLTGTEPHAFEKKFPGRKMPKGKIKLPSTITCGYEYYQTWNPNGGTLVLFR